MTCPQTTTRLDFAMHAPATASPGAMALLALAEHGEACGACDILTPSTAYPRSDYDARDAAVSAMPEEQTGRES